MFSAPMTALFCAMILNSAEGEDITFARELAAMAISKKASSLAIFILCPKEQGAALARK